jgi:hypothetical protein
VESTARGLFFINSYRYEGDFAELKVAIADLIVQP